MTGSAVSFLRSMRTERGLSQVDLAMEAGVSRHSILRMEQLCYPTPLPNVIQALSDITGVSETELVKRYQENVHSNRELAKVTYFYDVHVLWKALNFAKSSTSKHPFMVWRETVMASIGEATSRIHFCSVVTVHPAILDKYESFKTGFPEQLEIALKESGIPASMLGYFKSEAVFNRVVD